MEHRDAHAEGVVRAWVVVEADDPSALPPVWRARASSAFLVPLLPGEARQVLHEGAASPALQASDAMIASLVARGVTTGAIAAELGVSLRTAQRRVATLRRRLGAVTKADLARRLAELGFG